MRSGVLVITILYPPIPSTQRTAYALDKRKTTLSPALIPSQVARGALQEISQSMVNGLRTSRPEAVMQFNHRRTDPILPVANFEDFYLRTFDVDLEHVDMINAKISHQGRDGNCTNISGFTAHRESPVARSCRERIVDRNIPFIAPQGRVDRGDVGIGSYILEHQFEIRTFRLNRKDS